MIVAVGLVLLLHLAAFQFTSNNIKMDFASLMSAEISKAKSPPAVEPAAKKYLKKADLEAQREEQYRREQEAQARDRVAKLAQKRKRDEDDAERAREREEKRKKLAEESRIRREEEEARIEKARRRRLGLPELPVKQEGSGTPVPEDEDIDDATLHQKLRSLNQPITLFGETHTQRLKRYKRLTAPSIALTKSHGPIPTTLEPVKEAEMFIPATAPTDAAARHYLYRQLSSYFNMLFSAWSATLSARDTATASTTAGKAALNTLHASLTSLKPLFSKFEQDTLEPSILNPLLEIVRAMQERRYVDANDAYLRLSIGKAAWPIGVTMVGIHERSAREKLHEDEKTGGHILSDEITRKFLQGIKRCLSFAQTRWPPEDFGQVMG